ncbi:MAG: hypothetical protein HN742_28425 [Lentisphaerae bacterium]|jgi:hypothetical protein|nr:hypothetical protein [Lentisphaerota bacterium]MBT4814705.1 hypothetical protein [Lentisphaerota bacterium]MBT5611787.1 hypothetical protein [Lentisphaerota bacterium]MBT7056943.1 hypothetical protein [Lentisphaerota bacterium]MBT7845833.1 hypothetical protein [Lentisphaerota bacterium]
MNHSVRLSLVFLCLATLLARAFGADSGPPSAFLHASFEDSIDAVMQSGIRAGKWIAKEGTPQFRADGIRGRALLVQRNGEAVTYPGPGTLPPDAWTISFWVKGIDGARWHQRGIPAEDGTTNGVSHFQFLEMFGAGGWTRLYKYGPYAKLFLLTQLKNPAGGKTTKKMWLPAHHEQTWHHHAIVWRRGRGCELFLDGRKVGADVSHEAVTKVTLLKFGQTFGDGTQRRLVDELIIRDRAMAGNDLFREYLTVGRLRTPQLMRIRQTRQPIAVDGTMSPDEWRDASVTMVQIDTEGICPGDTPTYLHASYDSENLYFAMRSKLPEEALRHIDAQLLHGFVRAMVSARDGDMSKDDTLTLELMPDQESGMTQAFRCNGTGTRADWRAPASGQTHLAWNPEWHVTCRSSMEGWVAEIAIPFSSLGVSAPKPGTGWGMNATRQWRQLKNAADTWSWGERDPHTGDVTAAGRLGRLVFGGPNGVAVQLEQLGPLAEGKVDIRLGLTAADGTGPLQITIGTEQGTLHQDEVTIEPNTVRSWHFAADLTQQAAGLLVLDVSSADGETVHYHLDVPFYVAQQLEMTSKHYPTSKQLLVQWLVRQPDVPLEQLRCSFSVLGGDSKAMLPPEVVASPLPAEGARTIDVQGLAVGEYTVVGRVLDGERVVTEKRLPFSIKPLPDWLGNTIGISADVPSPWTPVEVDRQADTVKVWGREAAYGDGFLPKQLTTNSQGILACPMRIEVSHGGGVVSTADIPAKADWQTVNETEATCRRSVTTGPVKLSAESITEFDGFTWLRLTIDPGKEGADIQGIRFVVPLRPEWAELYNPYDYACRLTGALPEEGFKGAMRPIWLGNHEGGIQVIAETSRTWWVENRTQEMTIRHTDDAVELQLNLIDHPTVLTEPVTIELGYIVTPVKPPPPRYRNWRVYTPRKATWRDGKLVNNGYHIAYEKRAMAEKRDIEIIDIWSTGWSDPHDPSGETHYPIPKASIDEKRWKRPLYWGGTVWSFPYMQLHNFWAESAEFRQFGHEWVSDTQRVPVFAPDHHTNARTVSVCQGARSYQDFIMFGIKQLYDQSSPRGFYFDVSRPIACNNAHHGCGIRKSGDGGGVVETTNFLGTRRLLRRIYTLVKQRHPDGLIFFHMSGHIAMPVYSFCDAMVDGENYTSILNRKDNRGYENVLSLDTFAAQYNTQNNLGPVSVFLPEFQRSSAIKDEEWEQFGTQPADYLNGLWLLHDGVIWWAYTHYEQLMKLFHALDALDWGHDYEFIPYWKQAAMRLPDGVVASFYRDRRTARTLAVVMNMNEMPVSLNAGLQFGALGVPQTARVRDILHEDPCSLDAGQLRVSIPAKTFRAILME